MGEDKSGDARALVLELQKYFISWVHNGVEKSRTYRHLAKAMRAADGRSVSRKYPTRTPVPMAPTTTPTEKTITGLEGSPEPLGTKGSDKQLTTGAQVQGGQLVCDADRRRASEHERMISGTKSIPIQPLFDFEPK